MRCRVQSSSRWRVLKTAHDASEVRQSGRKVQCSLAILTMTSRPLQEIAASLTMATSCHL